MVYRWSWRVEHCIPVINSLCHCVRLTILVPEHHVLLLLLSCVVLGMIVGVLLLLLLLLLL